MSITETAGWEEATKRIEEAKRFSAFELDLSRLNLAVVPDSLAQLPNLQYLYLIGNRLTTIPGLVAQLTDLRGIRLDHNRITAIPDDLARLPNLQSLHLEHNEITTIPESLTGLSSLMSLHLESNRITAVPHSLHRLSLLQELGLEGNPLPEELLASLNRGVEPFLRYLRATADRSVYPRTVKIVLLGEPKSGKTTLLEALKGNPNPCDDSRQETIGVNVVTIEKQHPGDHQPMYLSTWDFAGQHIEHATHQFFLTENAIYVILWNARQGTDSGKHDLWYWLELLKMRVRTAKFVLVATHTEHTPPDLNLSEIRRAYSGCQGHLPVELSNLRGFIELERMILELAADSPSLRAAWPPAWLAVRDEIRQIRNQHSWLPPAAFRDLMAKNGVSTSEPQRDLANQLHDLGEVLYFREIDELSKLVMLDPQWVTELVALVVRSKIVREQKGLLRETDIEVLWQDFEIPHQVRDHLIRLMDWFDLTYSTGHPTDLGIVVEALPYCTQEDLEQLDLGSGRPKMEMIFRFPSMGRHLPPGIPTWGIARAHRLLKGTPWRDAAAFVDPDTNSEAIILASDARKEVTLHVAADYPPFFFGRMEAILRDTFKRYPGAEPERRLPCPCRPSCPHSYRYEIVLKRLQGPNKYVICDDSGVDVSVESLLSGVEPPDTEYGLTALRAEMRRIETQRIQTERDREEKTCPSIFTLVPTKEFKLLDTWIESMAKQEELELVLYCEHDSGWHPTPNSVYRFRIDSESFELIGKYWTQFLSVTRRVGPLLNAFGATSATAVAINVVAKLFPPATHASTNQFPAALGQRAEPDLIDIEMRFLLQRLVAELDSKRPATQPPNGGLKRQIVDDGRLLWLCPEHFRLLQGRPSKRD